MSSKKFVKKPVEVTALQWTGENIQEVKEFTGPNVIRQFVYGGDLAVYNTLEKCYVDCPINHWIIKGVKGEFYPCDPEVLSMTYDEIKAPVLAEASPDS